MHPMKASENTYEKGQPLDNVMTTERCMKDLEKNKCRIGLVQAEPVLFDKKASLDKALGYIREAAAEGAELIVFPELFIPQDAGSDPVKVWKGKEGN